MIQFDGAKLPLGSPVLKAVSYDYGKAQLVGWQVGWQEAFTTLSGMPVHPVSLSLLTILDLIEEAISIVVSSLVSAGAMFHSSAHMSA